MLQEVKEKERRGEDVETAQAFRQVLNGMSEFAAAPNIATWSKVATSIGFGMTLGLNVSSAMLNLMQLPMIVAPYLSGRYGMRDTFKALTEAFTIFRNSARPHEVEYFSDTQEGELIGQRRVEGKTYTAFHPSLDNYDFDNPNNTLARDLNMSPEGVEELRVLRNVMGELGNLHRSITEDVLDMDSFTGSGTEKALQAVNGISGWMFHHTEKINRQVTAIAAYRLAVAKAKKGAAGAVGPRSSERHGTYQWFCRIRSGTGLGPKQPRQSAVPLQALWPRHVRPHGAAHARLLQRCRPRNPSHCTAPASRYFRRGGPLLRGSGHADVWHDGDGPRSLCAGR
jgi:hypothetical protein